jgi:hypothetical protein
MSSTSAAVGPGRRTEGAGAADFNLKAAISLANLTRRPPRHPRFLFGGTSGTDGAAGAAGVSLSEDAEEAGGADAISLLVLLYLLLPTYFILSHFSLAFRSLF